MRSAFPPGTVHVRVTGAEPKLPARNQTWRSEEHTSELQSQSNLVCRLLLEKKNESNPRVGSSRNRSSASVATSMATLIRWRNPRDNVYDCFVWYDVISSWSRTFRVRSHAAA